MDEHAIAYRHKTCKTLVEWWQRRYFLWGEGSRWFCPQCGRVKNRDVERVRLAVTAVEAGE